MARSRLLTFLSISFAALLMLSACGEDSSGNNGSNGDNDTGEADTGVSDTGGSDTGDDDTNGGGDTGDNDTGPTDTGPECTEDDDCGTDMVCSESNECIHVCDSSDAPARCTAEQGSFSDWGPASVVSSLEIAGWENDCQDRCDTDPDNDTIDCSECTEGVDEGEFSEANCCFDFDSNLGGGDEETDNGLGDFLTSPATSAIPGDVDVSIPGLNAQLQGAIDDGSLIIVFEHQGLDTLPGDGGDDDFVINFLLGELTGDPPPDAEGSNQVNISPESFRSGTFPQARLPEASLSAEGVVTAGPGTARLQLDLVGASLSLQIREAQIEATIPETPASNLEDGTGVYLREGKLGGYATVGDLIDAVNGFTESNCGCYEYPEGREQLITYDESNPAGTASCPTVPDQLDVSACEDESICKQLGEQYCGVVGGLGTTIADLDLNQDGTTDAISVGLNFETGGGEIMGVATGE